MKKYVLLLFLLLTLSLIVSVNDIHAFSHASGDSAQKNPDMRSQQGTSLLSGKVVETMDSGGYTYISIEKDGKNTWVAVPHTEIKVGENVSFLPGMVMNNFTSKTLNRTFETIIFSSGTAGQSATGQTGKSADNKQTTASPSKTINVQKAAGPDAYTVAELYEKSGELDQKNVVIRGQVVRFSPKIMGKNWIHIQDGSGNPSKGTNDLLVTSQDVLSVDDIVTVKGTLSRDKDFGGRYKYAVIVEQASVQKEH